MKKYIIKNADGSEQSELQAIYDSRKEAEEALKYRPFKDIEECWQEMQEHEPFGWLIDKADGRYILIKAINEHGVEKAISKGKLGRCLSDIMKVYSFADGTPFGMKEEK